MKPKKQSTKLQRKPLNLKKNFNDKYILIEMIKFLYEGSIQGTSISWLPALPSRLLGQLETHQASRLLH